MKNFISRLAKGFILLSLVYLLPSCFGIVLFDAPDTAQSGSTISVKARVKTDVSDDKGFRIAFVLSYDPIYDNQDIVLKTDSVTTPVSPFGFYDVNANFTIPNNTPAGKYYLLAIPNERWLSGIFVYERQENVAYRPITITGFVNNGKDITTTNAHVYSPKRIEEDWTRSYDFGDIPNIKNNLRVTFATENRGLSATTASTTFFYLIKDNRPYLIGSTPIPAMTANGRFESTLERNIASYNLPSGYYELIILSDYYNQVAESNENNNYLKKGVNIIGNAQNAQMPESNVTTTMEKEALNKALLAANQPEIGENTEGGDFTSFEKSNKTIETPLTLTLFPNPTSEKVTVSFHQEKTSDVTIQLFDASGKMVSFIGLTKLAAGQYQQEIPLNKLNKGVYVVKCLSGQKMSSQKLVID